MSNQSPYQQVPQQPGPHQPPPYQPPPYQQQPYQQQYQQAYQQPYYPPQAPYYHQTYVRPRIKPYPGYWKIFFLSLITFGIYGLVVWSRQSDDIDTIARPYDGQTTLHYLLVIFLLSPLTFGIWAFIWDHQLSDRIGNEARRRGIDTDFSATTFWLWRVLGSLILVGPIVYGIKKIKALSLIHI